MSKNEPSNSFLFFETNKGSRLGEGFYPINDEFLHIFVSKDITDSKHPVRIQFSSRLHRFFGGDDYAHFAICLTSDDAKKLLNELLGAVR